MYYEKDPFTNDDDLDKITMSQVFSNAENEADLNFTRNNEMNEATAAAPAASDKPAKAEKKAVIKKKPAAKPADEKKPAAKKSPAKAEKKPAAKKSDAPRGRQVPEGHVGLDKLAKEFKSEPAALRRKLRRSGEELPDHGVWSWKDGSRDLQRIRKVLGGE